MRGAAPGAHRQPADHARDPALVDDAVFHEELNEEEMRRREHDQDRGAHQAGPAPRPAVRLPPGAPDGTGRAQQRSEMENGEMG